MKVKTVWHLNITSLISAFIFFICIRITYLNVGIKLTFMLKTVSIIILVSLFIFKRKKPENILVISGWYVIILGSTLLNQRNIFNAADILSSSYLICLYLSYFDNSTKNKLRILETWTFLLFVLCVADGISILLYPNGMPTNSYFKLTWFLGYKTARLAYILPLAVLISYLSYLKKRCLNITAVAVILLCTIICFRVQATAAGVAMLLFLILNLLMEFLHRKRDIREWIYKILNYKILCIGYGFLFFFVTIIQTNPFIQYIIQNILNKSDTLSYRTGIWAACLNRFFDNPLLGCGYLTNAEYTIITNYPLGTSAHSFILSILVTTGIVGLVYYIFMLRYFLFRHEKSYEYHEAVALFGLLCILIVGITSSAMVFSVFSGFIYILIDLKYSDEFLIKR